jgi:hypothetical protein
MCRNCNNNVGYGVVLGRIQNQTLRVGALAPKRRKVRPPHLSFRGPTASMHRVRRVILIRLLTRTRMKKPIGRKYARIIGGREFGRILLRLLMPPIHSTTLTRAPHSPGSSFSAH